MSASDDRYNHSAKGRVRYRRYEEKNPQVSMFGLRIRVPIGFKETAIALREERRRSTQGVRGA